MRFMERRRPQPRNPAVWRRYRVSQAHELRRRLRSVPPIAAALFLVASVALAVRYPKSAVEVLAVNGLAALILFAFRPLARLASPRGVVCLALLMPTVMASLAIIPIGAPLLLAWDATTNRRWAVAYGLGVGLLALLTGFGSLSMNHRLDVASVVGMCCVVGALAANLLQGLRLQSIEQELELRRLNRVLHGYATTDPLTRLLYLPSSWRSCAHVGSDG